MIMMVALTNPKPFVDCDNKSLAMVALTNPKPFVDCDTETTAANTATKGMK